MNEAELADEQTTGQVLSWDTLINVVPQQLKQREELTETPKTRGRPRKWVPKVEGKMLHRMDDSPASMKHVPTPLLKQAMIREFKTLTAGTAADRVQIIADRFKVSYSHAHSSLKDVI